jgi:hypothetical protein
LKNIEGTLGEIPLRLSLFSFGIAFWHPRPSHESRERTLKIKPTPMQLFRAACSAQRFALPKIHGRFLRSCESFAAKLRKTAKRHADACASGIPGCRRIAQ